MEIKWTKSVKRYYPDRAEPHVREERTSVPEAWGPFLESPDNFSGPESYFMYAMFALKTQILLVLKAEQ